MRKLHEWLSLLGLSVLALTVVDACASDAKDGLGRMMVGTGAMMAGGGGTGAGGGGGAMGTGGAFSDAGKMLMDAGQMLMDAGGGGSDAGAQAGSDNTGGSRIELRQVVDEGVDGTKFRQPLATYYDTELDVACTLQRMRDGTTRCFPQSPGAFTGNYFGDVACTQRVALVAGECGTPKYVAETIVPEAPGCEPTHSEIYEVGTEVGTLYTLAGAVCSEVNIAGYRFFQMGPAMSPSMFVAFSQTTETR